MEFIFNTISFIILVLGLIPTLYRFNSLINLKYNTIAHKYKKPLDILNDYLEKDYLNDFSILEKSFNEYKISSNIVHSDYHKINYLTETIIEGLNNNSDIFIESITNKTVNFRIHKYSKLLNAFTEDVLKLKQLFPNNTYKLDFFSKIDNFNNFKSFNECYTKYKEVDLLINQFINKHKELYELITSKNNFDFKKNTKQIIDLNIENSKEFYIFLLHIIKKYFYNEHINNQLKKGFKIIDKHSKYKYRLTDKFNNLIKYILDPYIKSNLLMLNLYFLLNDNIS